MIEMGISDFIAYIPIFLPACKWKRLSVWMYEERYKFIFRRTVTREEIESFIEKEYQEQKDNVQKAWLKITLDKYYNPGETSQWYYSDRLHLVAKYLSCPQIIK